ncbi:MAG: AraC family transcriptional regulator [Lachnospiraceae bacterium]|nr:AraC family transcriptional regulator [Lachnospiraceae bacterium]
MRAKQFLLDDNRQEVMQNIPGFPVTCYLNAFSGETYDIIDWHWHVDFQLCLVTGGTVLWKTENQEIHVTEGDGIFIHSQKLHMARAWHCPRASFLCVDFTPDFLCPDRNAPLYRTTIEPILKTKSPEAVMLTTSKEEEALILSQLKDIGRLFAGKEEGYEYRLISALYDTWRNLYPLLLASGDLREVNEDTRLKDILSCLQKNYARDLTLDEIAESAGLSRSECCRYFKKKTGQTIFEYLIQYRIRKSLHFLNETDWTIARIAQENGFSSQSYFTSCFRKVMGMTPSQYIHALQFTGHPGAEHKGLLPERIRFSPPAFAAKITK